MTLTAAEIKAFKPADQSYKRADGKGLYIEVAPSGSKLWRWKYRVGGKEKRLALGAWPETSLAKARELRDEARRQLNDGEDPALRRKKAKATAQFEAANTFAAIGAEYIEKKMMAEGLAKRTVEKAKWHLDLLSPAIGNMPISDVDPQMLLAALRKLEARGTYETAKKCRGFASRVFRFAIWTGRAEHDPAAALNGALTTPKAKHYAAILDPGKLGELLRVVDDYDGQPITKLALQVTPHVFVRPGELRHAEWEEFDLEAAIWRIPEGKMKARRAHAVPLSRQVLSILEKLKSHSGSDGYVFPSFYTAKRPMSENTVNVALRRMGFSKDEVTAHGFRATASTLLNESGKWNPDAIERALSHGDSDAVRGAYSRGNYWEERVQMAQWWSDYLDQLRSGGEVVKFDSAQND
ncbi:tyrosine-type recombinase/integrase [Erythrobacter ani]|uniref:Integrase arm-type DNA-binding domain-containing protein n=1 Tax=Erythrobacter ani TaxID=2827235 RepID=A0ABS6SN94_9SPHN|nr:integrase arm-type DNA-binding domain-containing protein [Erythrobacter ani]MBV7265898.1 integrase arm-type DNA-binding domain-containing protein [Erythrobacter ani]